MHYLNPWRAGTVEEGATCGGSGGETVIARDAEGRKRREIFEPLSLSSLVSCQRLLLVKYNPTKQLRKGSSSHRNHSWWGTELDRKKVKWIKGVRRNKGRITR